MNYELIGSTVYVKENNNVTVKFNGKEFKSSIIGEFNKHIHLPMLLERLLVIQDLLPIIEREFDFFEQDNSIEGFQAYSVKEDGLSTLFLDSIALRNIDESFASLNDLSRIMKVEIDIPEILNEKMTYTSLKMSTVDKDNLRPMNDFVLRSEGLDLQDSNDEIKEWINQSVYRFIDYYENMIQNALYSSLLSKDIIYSEK